MGGKFPSRLAPRLGAELANLYRLTFDKDARATNADTGTRFSRLIEVAIDVLGDDYKGPRSNGPRGRGPGARTVAMRGRSYWDQRLKRNSSQLLAAPEFPDAPAGDVFDLFIDGWNDVRHGSPPHDVAQAFLDALDARRREVSGNEGGDSDP